jgi:ABC-2 type transport system ATP-binding protein
MVDPAATGPKAGGDGDYAVEVRGLTKSYGGVRAVTGIDFHIARGEVFALLGPNGAGKTTTVEILEGFRQRDGGEVSVLGYDPGHPHSKLHDLLGIVLQSSAVDPYLTVEEMIGMFAHFFPHPRPVGEVIELVGLEDKRSSRVVKLSGGQQRRLDVAIALAGDPELLFLDEPTTGFDPSARRGAWEVVKNLAALGKTVLLTTHYMDEAQYLADRVAVIAAGHIVAEGTPATIGGRDQARPRVRFRVPVGSHPPAELAVETTSDGLSIFATEDITRALHTLTTWAIDTGVMIEGLEVLRPSLEDVYLELTGEAPGNPGQPVSSGAGEPG